MTLHVPSLIEREGELQNKALWDTRWHAQSLGVWLNAAQKPMKNLWLVEKELKMHYETTQDSNSNV